MCVDSNNVHLNDLRKTEIFYDFCFVFSNKFDKLQILKFVEILKSDQLVLNSNDAISAAIYAFSNEISKHLSKYQFFIIF